MYATPASFFTISGRGYPSVSLASFDDLQNSEEASSSAPAIPCALLLTQPTHVARVYLARHHTSESILRVGVPTPEVFQFGLGDSKVCSQPLSLFPKALTFGRPSQVRCASCRGTSPKRSAPFYSSAPTYQPSRWRLRQSCLWLGTFNLAVQDGLWARSRIQAKRCAPVWYPVRPCALFLQPTDCSRA